MAERFVARPSPLRILLIEVGALGFVLLGAWIAGLFGPPPRPGQQWAGWLAIAFFGLCAAVGFFRLFEREPVLVVDRTGLCWRRVSPKVFPWSAMRWIEPRSIRGNRFVCIHLDEPPLYSTGWAGAVNRTLGFGDIAVSTVGTDRRFDELLAALREHAPADIRDF